MFVSIRRRMGLPSWPASCSYHQIFLDTFNSRFKILCYTSCNVLSLDTITKCLRCKEVKWNENKNYCLFTKNGMDRSVIYICTEFMYLSVFTSFLKILLSCYSFDIPWSNGIWGQGKAKIYATTTTKSQR